MAEFDFEGWATKANLKCTDGRVIMKDAFKHHDGQTVPLVWSHQHNDPTMVLGNALLQNRPEGVYAYCKFNDTETGQAAKTLVEHGDVKNLSICAGSLRQTGPNVEHGVIREVSLVLAGANPGASIENVMKHGVESEDEAIIYTDEELILTHADEEKEEEPVAEVEKDDETVEDVINSMTEKQQKVMYALIGEAMNHSDEDDEEEIETETDEDSNEGGTEMKHNVFEQDTVQQGNVLTHADQTAIIAMAKQSNVGSFKQALKIYAEEHDMLQHADGDNAGIFENYDVLFPELELLKKGEPETIFKNDQSWILPAFNKIHKSPYSRIRTRFADARLAELKAKGYQKRGDQKTVMGQIKVIGRETTPQTFYIKDDLHRDDIIDITDFDIVEYQWKMMRAVMNETLVLAAMVGDGREFDDPDKISEEHIRPIWKDDEEYTIHHDVDIEAAKKELQGTNTGANFGENYIYAEAVITAALYAREKFKGTGTPDFYCTPHLVNIMLLARDLNGRRIYDSKADLAKALNCNSIIEAEQFEGLTRTTEKGATKKLLGIFVNLNDYTFGSTRGGAVTRLEDFDMDFNRQKFMLEGRASGSLYKLKSAIALEEPVAAPTGE